MFLALTENSEIVDASKEPMFVRRSGEETDLTTQKFVTRAQPCRYLSRTQSPQ